MPRSGGVRRSENIPTAPLEVDLRLVRRSRRVRTAWLGGVAAFVILGLTSLLGARTSVIRASQGGYDLTLAYPSVSRPGLAIRWILTVHREGGFDGPVRVATSSRYFDLFDFNNLDPTPASVVSTVEVSIWEFDPPPGDTLVVTLDGRIEPAQQAGRAATTSVLEGDVPVVSLAYQTRVMP